MPRQQTGYIWKHGGAWYGRWREDVLEDGVVVRKQRSVRLAEVCDRYRTKADVRPLLADVLRPINEGKTRPEGTLPIADFVETFYLPFVKENFKPSTVAGYNTLWSIYVKARLSKIVIRDFRTVDAATLLAEIYRSHHLGRTTLKHIKSLLSGIFTFAKNQGAFDGINPMRDAMIPKKATKPAETYATTPDEVLAMMDVLSKAGEHKASAAVALTFFAGLRPGEARGACWEDFDGSRITVRNSVWHTHATSPKTEGSAKPVPIIEPLHLANRVVIPTLEKAGLRWNGWYSLRRGVATAVTALSKDSLAAKGLLRHSSVSTTERHYIKDVPENTLQAMKKLEALCNCRRLQTQLSS